MDLLLEFSKIEASLTFLTICVQFYAYSFDLISILSCSIQNRPEYRQQKGSSGSFCEVVQAISITGTTIPEFLPIGSTLLGSGVFGSFIPELDKNQNLAIHLAETIDEHFKQQGRDIDLVTKAAAKRIRICLENREPIMQLHSMKIFACC